MFRILPRLWPLLSTPFVFSKSKQEEMEYLAKTFSDRINQLKKLYGTQMMSFPNVTFKVKGDLYSASFAIDDRRRTLADVFSYLDSMPGATLLQKSKL